jgi:hypothetical protein
MTAFFLQQYFKQHKAAPGKEHSLSSAYCAIASNVKPSAAKFLQYIFAVAAVSDPVLWINIKTGWQQVTAYYQLIKK